MSTHNICFCREIRKIWILFGGKKHLIESYVLYGEFHKITVYYHKLLLQVLSLYVKYMYMVYWLRCMCLIFMLHHETICVDLVVLQNTC